VVGGAEVLGGEAGFGAGFVEGLCGVVLADAAEIDDAGVGKEVLGAAGGVLGCAAGEELGVAGEEVGVDAFVLVFGEDGIVGLEGVLGEEILAV